MGPRMNKETDRRIPLEDLLVFHQVARSLTSSLDLDAILRTIIEQRRAAKRPRCAICA